MEYFYASACRPAGSRSPLVAVTYQWGAVVGDQPPDESFGRIDGGMEGGVRGDPLAIQVLTSEGASMAE